MKQLAIAALAIVASTISVADIQAQDNPPSTPKVAPAISVKPPVFVDLSKPLPKTIDVTVGNSVVFLNGTSKIQAADTDGKGQIFKDQTVMTQVAYGTVRVGSGEFTVTNGTQVDKITVNVMYPPRPAIPPFHKGPARRPQNQAPVKVDLSQPLPKQLQLSVGQQVVLVNGAQLKTETKDTDGKGKLLQPRPSPKNLQVIVFEATREGKGELNVTFPTQGKLQVIHTETIPVEVVPAPAQTPAPLPKHRGFKPLPRPKAAVQVDLSKALPNKIQLTVGQKVVLFNDKAKVEAKETDGKGGLLKDVPHKQPNLDMYVFEATREGKGELKLAFPNTGLATKPRLETIPVEVIAPPPAPAPKPKQQQPGNPAIKKSGVIGATIEGPIMGNPPNVPGRRIANFAPVGNATIVFKDANNKEAGRTTSDQSGKFTIDLPEGDYVVESEHPNKDKQSGLPRNFQGKVTVGKNGRSHLVIRYDTGRP